MADLLFSRLLPASPDLLFGDAEDDGVVVLVTDSVSGIESEDFWVNPNYVPPLSKAYSVGWKASSVAKTASEQPWLQKVLSSSDTEVSWPGVQTLEKECSLPWSITDVASRAVWGMPWKSMEAMRRVTDVPWQSVVRLGWRAATGYWNSAYGVLGPQVELPWKSAQSIAQDESLSWDSGLELASTVVLPWVNQAVLSSRIVFPWKGASSLWAYGRAWPVPPDPPDPFPCYTRTSDLLFKALQPSSYDLLFVCERDLTGVIVVPTRKVYVVINNVHLIKVSGAVELPLISLSLSIDYSAWTWTFSAKLHGSAASHFPAGTSAVDLEAQINGESIRLKAEKVRMNRTFGKKYLSISGRGRSAELGAPYAPILSKTNTSIRTANQLMDDVLVFNAVPIGWTVDWTIDDWNVPANVFVFQGTYIEGLLKVAGAAGAYLQPHPTNQEMRVLHPYPVAPWDWGSVTPDIILPAGPVSVEGIEYVDKPEYNRVWVQAESVGVRTRVTIDGTDGSLSAPMVVDPLISTEVPGRQKGLAILGDTGRQAHISLRLPVLTETGLIMPGTFLEYSDGTSTHFGITRSLSVDTDGVQVWQTIMVETHV